MKPKNLIILISVVLVIVVGGLLVMRTSDPSKGNASQIVGGSNETPAGYYTCPMHPSVRSDRPGACPVCGMALVKKTGAAVDGQVNLADLRAVTLSPTQRVLANISTTPAQHRNLRKEITAVGLVEYAEPRYTHVSMRYPGRLEKLYLGFVGMPVKKGDPVADVYSPEAVSAQQEYLTALSWHEQVQNSPGDASRAAKEMVDQARQKLELWDFTKEQIDNLRNAGKINYIVTMYAPISGTVMKKNVYPQHYAMTGEDIYDLADLSIVWVYLDIYEKDIRYVSTGQPVEVVTEAYPGERFTGKVTFIDPVVNPDTRTVRVRTEFTNAHGKLKPNMYVTASVRNPAVRTLVVPSSAVLSTGKRTVVWVEVQGNAFEPRDVAVGTTTEGWTEILSGLREGELVAETGGYLIDSESALQGGGSADPHAGHGMAPSGDIQDGKHEVNIHVKGSYSPATIHLKKGVRTTLNFHRDEDSRCTEEIIIKDFGIRKKLAAWKTTTIELTPDRTGEFQFACGMDMAHGTIVVEE